MVGETELGTVLTAHEKIRAWVDTEWTDQRGWGRFGGFKLRGAKGARPVIVGQVMLSPTGSADWRRQMQWMVEARARGEQGIKSNPREQAYSDLFNFLQSWTAKGAALIIMGDFNDDIRRERGGGVLATIGGQVLGLSWRAGLAASVEFLGTS